MTRDRMELLAAQLAAGIISPHELLDAVDDDFDIFMAVMDIANGEEPTMPVRSQPLFSEDEMRDIGMFYNESTHIYYVTLDGVNTFCGITETAMYDLGSIGDKKLVEDAMDYLVQELNDLNFNITPAERRELIRIFGF